MKKPAPELFNKRSATNDFLFSSPEEKRDEKEKPPAGTPPEKETLLTGFHDLLDRKELVLALSSDDTTALCVIAVQLEHVTSSSDPAQPGELADLLPPLARICTEHDGLWAHLGASRFAFALPQMKSRAGCKLARALQAALPADGSVSLTAGVAVYPTLDDIRAQTIDNAEKALVHAGFFGPGSVTPFDAVSLNISGDRRYQAGDIQGAIQEFKKGLQLDSSDPNLLNSLGVCHGVLQEYEKALTAFETAISLAPDEMMPVYNQGFIFLSQEKPEEALAAFQKADRIEPGVFEVVFHIGQIYLEKDDPKQARPYLEAAAAARKRFGPAWRHLGACLARLDQTKAAIQAYKEAVKINPQDAEALSTLGRLYTQRKESLDVAALFCEQSVLIEPDNGCYRHRLGCVYLEQERLDGALAEFEIAVTLGHDSQAMIDATQDRMVAAKAS